MGSPDRPATPISGPGRLFLLVVVVAVSLFSLGFVVFFSWTNNITTEVTMVWPFNSQPSLLLAALASAMTPTVLAESGIDLSWHPSSQTPYNNLTEAINGTGVYKLTFDPSGNWEDGTYNWCNMPHVRKQEYKKPSSEYELKYVEVIHRHHKRTPYASNAFPVESYPWNCDDQGLFLFAQPLSNGSSASPSTKESAHSYWKGQISPINPFVSSGWVGTCQFPQITSGGLEDSWRHGEDLYGVYHDLLGFLPSREDPEGWRARVKYRVTQNAITSQVAGMLISGMWRTTEPVPLNIQAPGVDSLEPQYSCPTAASALSRVQTPATSPAWAAHLTAAAPLYQILDDISGVPPTDSGFHKSLDHYYDNLSARQCHAKPLPCKITGGAPCVTQELADRVYRLGHWEYAHIYRGSEGSFGASAAGLGVWVAELAANLRRAAAGASCPGSDPVEAAVLMRHNIAHDGSISRLLSVLQLDEMIWPGMGAEVVFELWRRKDSGGQFVRVLFSGKVLKSASPALGTMDMVPLSKLLAYFDGLVGKKAGLIVGKCNGSIPL